MESTHQTPSVILKLMGLDKVPPKHPIQDKPKVLSDEYFQKVASIGVRKKRSSCQHHSFGMSTDEKEESEDVLKVVKTIRRNKHHNPGNRKENLYLFETKAKGLPQKLVDASYKSGNRKPETLVDAVSSFDHETSANSGRAAEQGHLQLQQTTNIMLQKDVHGHEEAGLYESFRFSKSQLDLKDETFNSRIAVLKANPGKGGNGISCISMQTGNAVKGVLDSVSSSFSRGNEGNEAFTQSSDMLKPDSNVAVNEIRSNSLFSCSGGAYVGSEAKNQNLEQLDVTKKFQAVERHDQGSTPLQLLTVSEHSYYGARNINNQNRFSNDNIKMNTICKVDVKYSRARKVAMTRPFRASSVIAYNRRSMDKDNFFVKYWRLRKNASANRSTQKSKNQSINREDCSEDMNLRSSIEKSPPPSSYFSNNHVEENSIDLQKLKDDSDLSDKKSMLLELSRSGSSTSLDNQILQEICFINDEVKKNKLEDHNMNIVYPNSSITCLKSEAKVEAVSRSHYHATMQRSESAASVWSQGDIDCLSHSSYASTQRDASEFQEDSACSLFSGTEPDSLGSFDGAYEPSPVSVLQPSFRENISSSLKVVAADEYDFSEIDDEEFGLNVSSDEDCEDEFVGGYEEKKDLMGSFRSEESRDFSYAVEVLNEAGISNRSLFTDFSTWHSAECPISPSVFEVLEKKFGEQQLWKRSERRLLFDRINVGLLEILQPCSYVPTWEKPVSRRLNAELSQDMIEEEVWGLLVAQEKKSNKDSADNMLGGEISWIELGENIEDIVREIVKLLIEELADETVRLENFLEV